MREQSKAANRRKFDSAFVDLYFVGAGIDVGCGNDSLNRTKHLFPRITSIVEFDLPNDAQTMAGVEDESFDFLHASHCLEHLENPWVAMDHWRRVVRPGGHLIITVPDFEMYERKQWPSRFSPEHLWAFDSRRNAAYSENGHLLDVWSTITPGLQIERFAMLRDHFEPAILTDQTLGPAECAIEIVLRKR